MGRRKKGSENAVNLFSFQDVLACLTGVLIMVSLLLCIDGLSNNMETSKGAKASGNPAADAARLQSLTEEVATLRRTLEQRKGGVDVTKNEVDVLEDRLKQMAAKAEREKAQIAAAQARLDAAKAESAAVDARTLSLRQQLDDANRETRRVELRERVRFRPGPRYPKSPVFIETMPTRVILGELDADRTPMLIARLDDPNADARIVGSLGARLPDNSYMVFVVHEDAIARFATLRDALIRRGYEVGWQLWPSEGPAFMDGTEPIPEAKPAGGAKPADAPAAPAPAGGAP